MKYFLRKYKFILVIALLQTTLLSVYAEDPVPDKPIINFVSINTINQKVILDWEASTSPNILRYKIYSLDISTFPVTGTCIDSVEGDILCYIHENKSTEQLIYTVTAIDATGESLLSGDYHRAVSVRVSYDSCRQEMNLNWEEYIGWKENLSGYRVFSKEGSGPFMEIALLPSDNLSFVHPDIKENIEYQYYIRAFDTRGRTSYSNIKSYYTFMPLPPSFINLDYVSVLDKQTVEISFSADLSGEINDFILLKTSSLQTPFTSWRTINNVKQSPFSINDQLPTRGIQTYYRIDAINSCSNPISSSNIGTNIVLRGEVEGSMAKLSWNPYTNYVGKIEGYEIYRMNEYSEYELISNAQPGAISYVEDLSTIGSGTMKGEISYQIKAIETDNNPNGIKGISRSNEITISVETKLFVPNAFSPNDDGMNDFFGPILDFTPSDYKMYIYERSGKMLFQTNDPYYGWDGTMNGSNKAKQGVYIYHIEYTSYSGVRKVKTGNLSLVNP